MVPATDVLIAAGLQVPLMDGVLVEEAGKAGADAFSHRSPIAAKAGTIWSVTVIAIVVLVAHLPASGVKV
jgi:hypothetical protein